MVILIEKRFGNKARQNVIEMSKIELKRKSITFKKVSKDFIETFQVEWSNSKHKNQWINTLRTYANPIIGDLSPSEIKTHHILSILKPIWSSKHETASRVRQ